ncbi:MAG: alpha/beta hydrolase [Promethearchaeota archaeon]
MMVNKRKEVYKTHYRKKLYIHIFEPKERIKNELLPAIVFFHGGGWFSGSPMQFFPHCEYFVKRGMITFSAEYRIRSKHRTTPIESVMDGKSVICWIRTKASNLGIDPNKIVAAGGSAGGHLALCSALIEVYEPADCTMSSKPNALVLFNPVVDTVSDPRIAGLIKGDAKDISPIHHIKKGLPPIIIFHGTRDKVIPFKDVELFNKKMKDLGNSCELVAFERKGHAFFNYGNYKNKPYTETVREADKFLSTLGYLKGEPTI